MLLLLGLQFLDLLLALGFDELAVEEGILLGILVKLLDRLHWLSLQLCQVSLSLSFGVHQVLEHVWAHSGVFAGDGSFWLIIGGLVWRLASLLMLQRLQILQNVGHDVLVLCDGVLVAPSSSITCSSDFKH